MILRIKTFKQLLKGHTDSGKAVTPTHTWVGNRFFLPYFLPKSFTKSDQDIRTL